MIMRKNVNDDVSKDSPIGIAEMKSNEEGSSHL